MGKLIVSIDFELRWGILDILGQDVEKYRENLLSVHENIPWILKVFEERDIAATWATVGAVGCEDWNEFDRVKPLLKPSYQNQQMVYDNDYNRMIDPKGKLYFAPELIKKILKTKKQELGTHTFGHIYGTEPNVTYEELKYDLLSCKKFFSDKFSFSPESLVFPRNQVIYADKLMKEGIITTYRGNEPVEYLSADKQRTQKVVNRVKIFLDAVNPFVSHAYQMREVLYGNVRSSAMFRIYLPNILRKTHLNKLKKNIINLKEDEIYHIWFHPHNIGICQKKKDDFIYFFDFIAEQMNNKKLESENMKTIFLKAQS